MGRILCQVFHRYLTLVLLLLCPFERLGNNLFCRHRTRVKGATSEPTTGGMVQELRPPALESHCLGVRLGDLGKLLSVCLRFRPYKTVTTSVPIFMRLLRELNGCCIQSLTIMTGTRECSDLVTAPND